jgi:hypothetical protein
MIDTLKLHLQDSNTIRIEKSQADKISVNTVANVGTGEEKLHPLARLSSGEYLSGTKAWLNTEYFQLDFTGWGAFLKFSLPKVYHNGDHNIYPIGKIGASKVFEKVEQSLSEHGVELPYPLKSDQWKVSRADLFSNALTEYPFYTYNAVFSMLQGKRMKGRQYGDTGFLWSNKSRQVSAYDKAMEAQHKGVTLPTSLDGKNIARVELRAMNSKAVRSSLPYSTGEGVINNWDESRQVYADRLQEIVFRYDDIQEAMKLVQLEEVEKLKRLRDSGNRYWIQHYLNMVGVASMLHLFNGWDGIRSAFSELIEDKGNRSRAVTKLEQKYYEASSIVEGIEPVPVSQLYDELKTKLLSKVA